ncbi:MAG TPA: hypothetical protein PKE37_15095 [Thiomonas arsenitoxydans]|uniref:hypothetical protein n=1 Tax=Thiomonas arsenitoxydans (strain DSM 22701 / CIP 110005 / 3As) TaxID=426114 RepID=UPI002C466F4E|nr:hypothetical protein [Thiomonas arsenitoxydans]HML83082.1 hypothetical protein [Thiomonas arsenitoxydans]
MICANCRRPLKHPVAEVGRMRFGRICAQRLGLIEQSTHRFLARDRMPVTHDPHTPDLFAHEDPSR